MSPIITVNIWQILISLLNLLIIGDLSLRPRNRPLDLIHNLGDLHISRTLNHST